MNQWLNKCHFGDCLETLRRMPDGIAQTCVTSPPYFGLRDYGHDGQIGLEETPEAFIAKLVEVFAEVKRVLRNDGTLWLNIGDSYAANRGYQVPSTKGGAKHSESQAAGGKGSVVPDGCKPKDLIGIPWMLAFALRADGWYLRQEIIWAKPNPMPESVTDRCTKSHESIFLLAKSEKYYCDMGAIKERAVAERAPGNNSHKGATAYTEEEGEFHRTKTGLVGNAQRVRENLRRQDSANDSFVPGAAPHGGLHREGSEREPENRNKRSVWTVATTPYKGAHFATFPTALIEPCILAGAPAGGVVLDCFFGSGTTGQVAQQLGRKYIGCELNPTYEPLQNERLRQPSLDLEAA
jgi:DNA modification methylase